MSAPAATTEQIRALTRTSSDRIVLVRARPVWEDDEQIAVGQRTATVVAAPTVLAVRAAIAEHRSAELLVVLTECSEHELGLDVLARVSRQRVRRLDPWELVRAELGVSALDPQLATDRWILDAIVQHKPTNGWLKPPSGFLQRDEAVRQLLELWLALPPGSSLEELLQWLSIAGSVDKLIGASDETRAGIIAVLARRFPEPAALLLELALAGTVGDLVPLGSAARVLWSASTEAELIAARVRFEPFIAGKKVTEMSARLWASAAEAVIAGTLSDDGRAAIDPWIVRAQQIVQACEATGWLAESMVLADGLEQRIERAGTALHNVTSGGHDQLSELEALLGSIEKHILADDDQQRVDTMRAAVRLARRVADPPPVAALTLPALAVRYRDDGGWIDRARHIVRQGDRSATVAAAYSELLTLVDAEREAVNETFAEQLRQWSLGEPGDSADLVPLEEVLARVVAPLAALGPVLLVVADGMSWPVAEELFEDLSHQGWLLLENDQPSPIGVSLLPTVTEASRTSLLCGRRVSGTAPTEAEGFRNNPALKALDGPAPVLFHKARLATAGGEALAPELRSALVDPTQRVVGVVINSIDDHLNRGMQVRVAWTANTVVPLRELLAEAAAGGRTVVLTSDHGHVLDEKRSTQRGIADPGERWRSATKPAGEQEITITGPRVLLGGGSAVMPTSDTLRYGPSKHGYHGGATPQEVLVPVAVLARSTSIPTGWGVAPDQAPDWWTGKPVVDAALAPLPAIVPPSKAAKPAATGQVGMFDVEPPVPAAASRTWIVTLLASTAFDGRRQIMQKRRLDDTAVVNVLSALEQRGGTALKAVIATDIGVQAFRLDGLLSALASVLNVEGYSVLEVRDDSVTLNRGLLLTQFGIDG